MISVAVNILLSCVQILLGIFSGSQGLIADGIHSFSDLVSDFVVLIANKKVASLLTKITITVMDAMKMGRR
jgi:divalent metal cation (Fe/Co/Zn/Cd) transporter